MRTAARCVTVATLALLIVLVQWGQRPQTPAAGPTGHAAGHGAASAAERTGNRIDARTDALGAVAVVTGQRPAFIPATVLTLDSGGVLRVCGLDSALGGGCGPIVAWIRASA